MRAPTQPDGVVPWPRQRRWLPFALLFLSALALLYFAWWGLLTPYLALLTLPGRPPWQRQIDHLLPALAWLVVFVSCMRYLVGQASLVLDEYGIGRWGWPGWRWLRWGDIQLALSSPPNAVLHGRDRFQAINLGFFDDTPTLRAAIWSRLPLAARTPSVAVQRAFGRRIYRRQGLLLLSMGLAWVWFVARARRIGIGLPFILLGLAIGIAFAWRMPRPWLERALPPALLPGRRARVIATAFACLPVLLAAILVRHQSDAPTTASVAGQLYGIAHTTIAAFALVRGISEWQLSWVVGREQQAPASPGDTGASTGG